MTPTLPVSPLFRKRFTQFVFGEGQVALWAVVAEDLLRDEPVRRGENAEVVRPADREELDFRILRRSGHRLQGGDVEDNSRAGGAGRQAIASEKGKARRNHRRALLR
jgi:hypothetical protein